MFNAWSKLPVEERTTQALLQQLDFDFFELLDSVTIARSRKHIQRYYDTTAIGSFPERKDPISVRPKLTDLTSAINYTEVFEQLNLLNLKIYTPTEYIQPSKLFKYGSMNNTAEVFNFCGILLAFYNPSVTDLMLSAYAVGISARNHSRALAL